MLVKLIIRGWNFGIILIIIVFGIRLICAVVGVIIEYNFLFKIL